MYTRTETETILEIQQGSTGSSEETHTLLVLWTPTSAGQTCTIDAVVEGRVDGSPDDLRVMRISGTCVFDGTNVTVSPTPSEITNGSVANFQVATDNGLSGDVLQAIAWYASGGPHTVNWKIRSVVEELS